MKRRQNKGGEGDRGRKEYASWFWPNVRRVRRRKHISKMQRIGKRILKKFIQVTARGADVERMVETQKRRGHKRRGHDGTMFGPFRSRGA